MYRKETEHGLIEIKDNVLYIDGINQGTKDSMYVNNILQRVYGLYEPGDTILMFGGGSFVIPKELEKKEIPCYTVEKNQYLIGLAKKYFKYETKNRVHCGDFREFLESKARFSFVLVDIFDGAIPTGVYDSLQDIVELSTKATIINWICPLPLYLLGPCRKLGKVSYTSRHCDSGLYQEIYEIRKY